MRPDRSTGVAGRASIRLMGIESSQQERFARDGYLLLPGLFDPEQLDGFERRFLALVQGDVPAGDDLVIMRDVMVAQGAVEPETPLHAINKILSFEDDDVLFAYARDPKLLSVVRGLIGSRVMTISTNVFNKPPGVDGRHPLHQDLRYFALRPEASIVGTWTAMGPVTRENGCLSLIPGSHRAGLLNHLAPDWEYVNGGFFAAQGVDLDQRVHLEMESGDTVLLHPLVLHGSGRNRSPDFRRAISVHFASQDCVRPPGRRSRAPVIRKIDDPEEGGPESA